MYRISHRVPLHTEFTGVLIFVVGIYGVVIFIKVACTSIVAATIVKCHLNYIQ